MATTMRAEEEKKAETPSPEPVVEPGPDKKKAQLSPEDLVPPENRKDGDKSQGDKKDEKSGKPAKEAVTEAEAERRKAVAAKWEDCLGKWLGGPLSALVLEHVSLDALNSYIDQGLKAAGPALGDALKGATKPKAGDQEKALKAYSEALSGVMTGLVEKWVASASGQKVLKSISNFVQGHPGWTMAIVGTALIGGGVAAWFANADLSKIEVPLGLPKGWNVKLGLDLGTIQNLGFNGAAITVANASQGFSFSANGKKSEKETDRTDASGDKVVDKKQEGSAQVVLGKDKEPKFTFGVNGSITESSDGLVVYTAGQKVELVDPVNGVRITIDETGKWDTKGNKDNTFSYQAKAGKEEGLNGSFNLKLASATVVDQQGNIANIASREVGVAVGKKALKFKASASEKTEDKGGESKTTKKADVGVEGQLTKGLSFTGQAGVEMAGDDLKVKFGGGVTAKVGDKTIELAGNYETDGEVKGRIKVGEAGAYTEVTGVKKGDVVTFSTKEVFKGGSRETTVTSDPTKGAAESKTTATADLGKGQTLTMGHGTAGSNVGYKGSKIGGTPVDASVGANFSPDGQLAGGNLGLAYNTDLLKAKLDLVMKDAKTSIGGSVGVTQGGFKLNTDLKLEDASLKHFGASVGFEDPDKAYSFLAGYKRDFLSKEQGYSDRFDLMLQYSVDRFATRFAADLTTQGSSRKANLDLGFGYDVGKNKDWQLMAGAKTSMMFDDPLKQNQVGVTPYVGLGFKPANVSVMFNYDTQAGAAFLSLGIPIGSNRK